MTATSCLLTEDQLTCSICLDVFTEPVSTPCGHNFCKACITEDWAIDVPCQCPMCERYLYPKPELQVNTLISDVADEFRRAAQRKVNDTRIPEQHEVEAEVPTHSPIKRTVLIFLVIVIFISKVLKEVKRDIPIKEKCKGTQAELVRIEDKIKSMIKNCQLKIDEIKRSVELSNKEADRAISEGVRVFTALTESVETGQTMLIKTITEQQTKAEEQAKVFITDLEQEISELKRRKAEVEQFSKAWLEHVPLDDVKKVKTELARVRRCAVNVTLDPDTAHASLILSDDLKEVRLGEVKKSNPYSMGGFCVNVLGKQGFSSGCFYFEVEVKKNSDWDFGVVGQINRSRRPGYWTLSLRNGKYTAQGEHLKLLRKPGKVGVLVDYERGVVSFYNVDTEDHIYSYTGCSFKETLFPVFSLALTYHDIAKRWYGYSNAAPLVITSVHNSE